MPAEGESQTQRTGRRALRLFRYLRILAQDRERVHLVKIRVVAHRVFIGSPIWLSERFRLSCRVARQGVRSHLVPVALGGERVGHFNLNINSSRDVRSPVLSADSSLTM